MIHSLPLFHRIAGQPVIVLGEGDMADAKARLVEHGHQVFVPKLLERRLGLRRVLGVVGVAERDAGLASESEGEEPNRRVVVEPLD